MSAPTRIWINGTLRDEFAVPASCQGFTVGYGTFETLVDRGQGPIALDRHCTRLHHACDVMGLPAPTLAVMQEAFAQVMQGNDCTTARLRFTVARGVTAPLSIATASPLSPWSLTERLHLVPWRRNLHSPLLGVKCTSYAENIIALETAKQRGAGEALFLNTRDELCEGATSNIFIVRDGQVHTPPLTSGCLPGVTRALVIEACEAAGIAIYHNQALTLTDLGHADEAFLTSSTRDVHSIASIDDITLAQAPGPVTQAVATAYAALLIR
jgi:branched-chain amino acid aminotransferase